jgi:hypothetical protein
LKITARFLMIGGLALFGSARPVVAESEPPPGSFLVYVTQASQSVNLGPSEHLLVFPMAVEIPGASLPAGSYIFRLVTPSLLQVMSATRLKVYATFFALNDSGDGDSTRERIKFAQNPEDDLPRIVGWYFSGGTGYEFVYPKPKRKPAERVRER